VTATVSVPLFAGPTLVMVNSTGVALARSMIVPKSALVGEMVNATSPVAESVELVEPPGLPETVRVTLVRSPGVVGVKRTSSVHCPPLWATVWPAQPLVPLTMAKSPAWVPESTVVRAPVSTPPLLVTVKGTVALPPRYTEP